MSDLDEFLSKDIVRSHGTEMLKRYQGSGQHDVSDWMNTSNGYTPGDPYVDTTKCIRCGVEINSPTNLCPKCLVSKKGGK